jgi:hypothetical protein
MLGKYHCQKRSTKAFRPPSAGHEYQSFAAGGKLEGQHPPASSEAEPNSGCRILGLA